MSDQIKSLLHQYGDDILRSEEFQSAFGQTHHKCMTVAEHSLGVAVVCLHMSAILHKMHIPVQERSLTVAALCHDLGIMGRHEKYKNDFECFGKHPEDSLEVIRNMIGEDEYDDIIENSVLRHMWPLTPVPPKYHEGVMLTAADKISAVMERLGRSPARKLDLRKVRQGS